MSSQLQAFQSSIVNTTTKSNAFFTLLFNINGSTIVHSHSFLNLFENKSPDFYNCQTSPKNYSLQKANQHIIF